MKRGRDVRKEGRKGDKKEGGCKEGKKERM